MRRKRRFYSKELKQSAIEMFRVGDKTKSEIETSLGIRPGRLGEWLRKSEENNSQEPLYTGNELERLRLENIELRQENERLKRVARILLRDE